MRLAAMSDYGLRLLMHLAQHPGRLVTIAEVAQLHALSQAHLMKVTHRLALAGWITTVRGNGGGMRLAHAPADIAVGAVLRTLEPDFQLAECFGDDSTSACRFAGDCRLAGALGGALQAFWSHLDATSLQDILPPRVEPIARIAAPVRRRIQAARNAAG